MGLTCTRMNRGLLPWHNQYLMGGVGSLERPFTWNSQHGRLTLNSDGGACQYLICCDNQRPFNSAWFSNHSLRLKDGKGKFLLWSLTEMQVMVFSAFFGSFMTVLRRYTIENLRSSFLLVPLYCISLTKYFTLFLRAQSGAVVFLVCIFIDGRRCCVCAVVGVNPAGLLPGQWKRCHSFPLNSVQQRRTQSLILQGGGRGEVDSLESMREKYICNLHLRMT